MGSHECAAEGGDARATKKHLRNHHASPTTTLNERFNSSLQQRKVGPSHLTQIQGDIHLVVDQTPGEGGALPPPLGPIDGVAHRVGVAGVFGVAVAAVLTLKSRLVGTYRHIYTES